VEVAPLICGGYVAEWDGGKASDILFESSTQTMNAAGDLQEFAFNVGEINLTIGNNYVFFLNAESQHFIPRSLFGMPMAGDQINGGFVFKNAQGGGWLDSFGGSDVFFKASLSPVPTPFPAIPLPAALPLFGTGLGILGFIGWRRRRKVV